MIWLLITYVIALLIFLIASTYFVNHIWKMSIKGDSSGKIIFVFVLSATILVFLSLVAIISIKW